MVRIGARGDTDRGPEGWHGLASRPWPRSPGLQGSASQGPVQVLLCKSICTYLLVLQSNMLIGFRNPDFFTKNHVFFTEFIVFFTNRLSDTKICANRSPTTLPDPVEECKSSPPIRGPAIPARASPLGLGPGASHPGPRGPPLPLPAGHSCRSTFHIN